MVKGECKPMAKNELLDNERQSLNKVSDWYKNTEWGFYTKIVWYSYVSIKPFFHGKDCLEMGPADGEMTKFLMNDFERLDVVDAAEKYVKAAEKFSKNITGFTSLFEEFEPNKKYDTIIMSHVLEHVVDPLVVLKLAKEWLNKDGRIIIVVPNADSLHRKLGVKLGMIEQVNQLNDQDIEIGHRRVYNRGDLDRATKSSGLTTISKGGIFLKLLSNKQMQDYKDDDLIEGMFELGKDLPQLCSEIYSICTL